MKIEHEHRGVRFWVAPRKPFPGIGWFIPTFDHLGRSTGVEESGGAFYDDAPDHPEGAYEWARRACVRFIDRTMGMQS